MDVELGDPGLQHPRAHGRIRSAQATLAAIEPRKHLFGITRVADVTGLDRVGIPVAIAIRPTARSVAVSQGKGIDLASAKVSALMEAIEVWHAENIEAPLVLASIADVAGRSCEVARLPMVAGSSRPDHARLLWIAGHDLVSGQSKLVPFEMVHADYAPPLKPGYGLFPASTNGLASGNHQLEAISSAICEVIERDALAVWHARPMRSAFDDPHRAHDNCGRGMPVGARPDNPRRPRSRRLGCDVGPWRGDLPLPDPRSAAPPSSTSASAPARIRTRTSRSCGRSLKRRRHASPTSPGRAMI